MKDKEEWLEISNLDKLVNFSRKIIYSNLGEQYADLTNEDFLNMVENMNSESMNELDRILPMDEAKNIFKPFVKTKKNKKTFETKLLIMESDYDIVLQQISSRMISNIVRGLVKKGLVESAFDEEKNDFVFWLKKEN